MGPKVSKGRPESPLVAPAGAKPSACARRLYITCRIDEVKYLVNGLNPPTADWLTAQGAGNQPCGCGMTAFLNRNERQNAATIEVAERSESSLVAPAGMKPSVFASMQCATCKNNKTTYFVNGLTPLRGNSQGRHSLKIDQLVLLSNGFRQVGIGIQQLLHGYLLGIIPFLSR